MCVLTRAAGLVLWGRGVGAGVVLVCAEASASLHCTVTAVLCFPES